MYAYDSERTRVKGHDAAKALDDAKKEANDARTDLRAERKAWQKEGKTLPKDAEARVAYKDALTALPPPSSLSWVRPGTGGWIWGRRTVRAKLAAPPTPEQTWIGYRQARTGRGSGNPTVGRRGGPLLFFAPFLPPCVAWWMGMTCATQFVREIPAEAGARKALKQA
ncbi:YfgM family protein [Streptomyces violascens]|uniref:hypothetical protein n=1 Tax=Streptomyces violascens TaxID=67381 RepID=UPI0036864926